MMIINKVYFAFIKVKVGYIRDDSINNIAVTYNTSISIPVPKFKFKHKSNNEKSISFIENEAKKGMTDHAVDL